MCHSKGIASTAGVQKPGEMYDQYRTALLKLAKGCKFQTITPDEILRDRLVFGIKDNKARDYSEKSKLISADTDEICHAAESMLAQLKVVNDTATVNAIKSDEQKTTEILANGRGLRESWNCGRKHKYYKRELCPAFGKMWNKCH